MIIICLFNINLPLAVNWNINFSLIIFFQRFEPGGGDDGDRREG